MKKLLSLLMALVMMLLPVLSLAESTDESAAASPRIYPDLAPELSPQINQVTFHAGSLFEMFGMADILNELSLVLDRQENGWALTVKLAGADLVTVKQGVADETFFFDSNLLSHPLAVTLKDVLTYLGEKLEAVFQNLTAETAQAQETAVTEAGTLGFLSNLDSSMLFRLLMVYSQVKDSDFTDISFDNTLKAILQLLLEANNAKKDARSEAYDVATSEQIMKLSSEDMLTVFGAFTQDLKASKTYMGLIDAVLQAIGMDTTAEMMLDSLQATLETFLTDLFDFDFYLGKDTDDNPVFCSAKLDLLGITYDSIYGRKTGENQNNTDMEATLSTAFGAFGFDYSHVSDLANAEDQFSLSLLQDGAEIMKAELLWSEGNKDLVIYAQDSEQFRLHCEALDEDDTSVTLDMFGMDILEVIINTAYTEKNPYTVPAEAVYPLQMTDEEVVSYVQEETVQVQLNFINILQNLPESVLSLFSLF